MAGSRDGEPVVSAPDLITFAEAEALGQQLHDHWMAMADSAPMPREDLGWADVVQFVLRKARDVVAARGEGDRDGR
jgi:hypothetical protein